MKRWLRLYKMFVRNSIARELEFRANFWAKIAQNVVWVSFFTIMVRLIFSKTDAIAGWNEAQAFVVLATGYLLGAISNAFFNPNLQEIPSHVRMGTLDYVLVKPISSQFWLSARKINFDALSSGLFSIGLVVYSLVRLGHTPSVPQLLTYLVMCAAGLTIFYSLQLMLMTLAIWFVRVDNLFVLSETVFEFSRWPTNIFTGGLRFLFYNVIPLAYLATLPAAALLGRSEFRPVHLLQSLLWAVFFFLLCRWWWRFALRFYSSASS